MQDERQAASNSGQKSTHLLISRLEHHRLLALLHAPGHEQRVCWHWYHIHDGHPCLLHKLLQSQTVEGHRLAKLEPGGPGHASKVGRLRPGGWMNGDKSHSIFRLAVASMH